jgi:hypothetical protein
MRVPPLAVAILLAALAVAGCKPAAPPAKDYVYPAWGFKVSLPGTPTETAQPAAPNGSTPGADRVESSVGGRHFAVWAADVSRTGMSLDDLAKAASGFIAKQMGANAGIPTYAATGGGEEGREYQLTTSGKWRATLRVFLAGGRFYEVIGSSPGGQDDPALKDFLTSFHITGAAPAAGNMAGGGNGG